MSLFPKTITAAQPAWLDGFQEQFVQTGQKVTLHCRFSGNPIPQVVVTLCFVLVRISFLLFFLQSIFFINNIAKCNTY